MKSLQKVHDVISKELERFDPLYARAYNEYVSNGTYKPENEMELVRSILNRFVKSGEYTRKEMNAYFILCWYITPTMEHFSFPAWKDVKEFMERSDEYSFGEEQVFHDKEYIYDGLYYRTGKSICMGNPCNPYDWYEVLKGAVDGKLYCYGIQMCRLVKGKFLNQTQDIREVEKLSQIYEPGVYAVEGYDRPVSAVRVTEFGEDALASQGYTEFFTNYAGKRFSAIKTGMLV